MYTDFFGFRELPFELTPNTRFLFLTARHREALATLYHAMTTAKGIAVLIGEAGTGKTTLARAALEAGRERSIRCVYINNPVLTRDEFIEYVAKGFGLSAEAARSKAAFLIELERVLTKARGEGRIYALVVDEAQSLSYDLLEEVRLLGNIETQDEKLMPIILAGQPELAARLNEPSLRQLKQRIALRCQLTPLSLHETASYIAGRIRTAGGESSKVFTREAVMHIHQVSGGIPRTISVICDNALVAAFALDRKPVSRDIILEVCRDFDVDTTPAVAQEDARTAALPAAEIVDAPAPADSGASLLATENAETETLLDVSEPPKRRMFSFF